MNKEIVSLTNINPKILSIQEIKEKIKLKNKKVELWEEIRTELNELLQMTPKRWEIFELEEINSWF
jgi:hypothetical protein